MPKKKSKNMFRDYPDALTLRQLAAKMLKKYGLRPIRYHDLRHTCASLLLGKNINMKVIQMWLGHSNMSTTADIYSHLDSSAKNESGRAIASMLGLNDESED